MPGTIGRLTIGRHPYGFRRHEKTFWRDERGEKASGVCKWRPEPGAGPHAPFRVPTALGMCRSSAPRIGVGTLF